MTGKKRKDVTPLDKWMERFMGALDMDYSYQLALRLTEIGSNPVLGYRTAGSQAELETGELLAREMERIGLEVTRDEITLDTWEFEKAVMDFTDSSGNRHLFHLGAYQTQFVTEGFQEFEVIYAGRCTDLDVAGRDFTGKLVLCDMDQRAGWWINYPTYQAHLKGAAALLAVQEDGYAACDTTALNAQNICGPADAPAFSISQRDAHLLKAAIAQSATGSVVVRFDARSVVGRNGKTYNIVGTIPGEDPDSIILMSGHYDCYFEGFQDDSTAVSMMLSIAKTLKEIGYRPRRTLVFCALAAEEWGVINSRYDWSTGAYNQIFKARPEWVGKAIINLNLELPGLEHSDTAMVRASYENKKFMAQVAQIAPRVEGVFPKGTVIEELHTWSDDFSFSLAGIPASRNDFWDSEFMETHYHSQFDNEDTYNPLAFRFNHLLYAQFLFAYDRVAVAPLDFTCRIQTLRQKLNRELAAASGMDLHRLDAAFDRAEQAAVRLTQQVFAENEAFAAALDGGDCNRASRLYQESRALNAGLLAAFKGAQDVFARLTWEDEPIFPHEHPQGNLQHLLAAQQLLARGQVGEALHQHLLKVDNNHYGYYFEREVFDYFTDYVLNQPADRLMWGAGRVAGHQNLFDLIACLKCKENGENCDCTGENAAVSQAIEDQFQLLHDTLVLEYTGLTQLADQLESLAH